jgi:hypothetical protein
MFKTLPMRGIYIELAGGKLCLGIENSAGPEFLIESSDDLVLWSR